MQVVGSCLATAMSLFAIFASGCAAGPSTHRVHMRVDADLNKNTLGSPTPVNVRIYQLKDRAGFDEADFDSLWRNEREKLGESLVAPSKLEVVTMGFDRAVEVREPDSVTPGDVKFVGVVGLFNQVEEDPTGETPWRACLAVDEIGDTTLSLRGYRIVKQSRNSP